MCGVLRGESHHQAPPVPSPVLEDLMLRVNKIILVWGVLCYGDYTGKATRECLHNQTWGDTNVLNCHSDRIGRVVDEVKH